MERPVENLIFDRTSTDVLNAKNNPNNSISNRGNYNISDFVRVETWTKYLTELLTNYGYSPKTIIKDYYNLDYVPTIEDINRIKTNLEILKQAFYTLSTTPTTDISKTSINYIDVNNMEKILFDIDYLIVKLQENFKYSNTFYSGTDLYLPFNTIL